MNFKSSHSRWLPVNPPEMVHARPPISRRLIPTLSVLIQSHVCGVENNRLVGPCEWCAYKNSLPRLTHTLLLNLQPTGIEETPAEHPSWNWIHPGGETQQNPPEPGHCLRCLWVVEMINWRLLWLNDNPSCPQTPSVSLWIQVVRSRTASAIVWL